MFSSNYGTLYLKKSVFVCPLDFCGIVYKFKGGHKDIIQVAWFPTGYKPYAWNKTLNANLRRDCQGINHISHQCLFYYSVTVYQHLVLGRYLYYLNINYSNKTLKVRRLYIVIS